MDQKIIQLQNQIADLENQVSILSGYKKSFGDLSKKIAGIEKSLAEHKHEGDDGSVRLQKEINLLSGQTLGAGDVAGFTGITSKEDGYYLMPLSLGVDQNIKDGFQNSQLNLQHYFSTDDTTKQTFFYGYRSPVFSGLKGSVKSGGSVLNQSEYRWETNELVGAYVIVYNTATTFDVFPIASNTDNAITVTGSFTFTGSANKFFIFVPVYLGAAEYPWRRIYVGEGTDAGLRFGFGNTAGGQNGLLYMDATGDLYWRNKAGSSTKLN